MGILKSNSIAASSASTFSMSDIETRAAAHVARARAEADRIIAEARTQAEKIIVEARSAGLIEGKSKGQAEGRTQGIAEAKKEVLASEQARLTDAIKTLSSMIEAIDNERAQLLADARENVLMLALAIAKKVCHRQGEVDPKVVDENVETSIGLLQNKSRVFISVHSTQKSQIDELVLQLKMKWPSVTSIEIDADDSIDIGGCRVRSGSGEIDADIDAQLDRIAQELFPNRAKT